MEIKNEPKDNKVDRFEVSNEPIKHRIKMGGMFKDETGYISFVLEDKTIEEIEQTWNEIRERIK